VEITPEQIALALGFVLLGATLQATVGFGMALIAAPTLLLIYPEFVPGPLMAASMILTGLVVWSERSHVDLSGMASAAVGRIVGTAAAAVFLVFASTHLFDLAFGLLVVLGVVLSAMHPALVPTRATAAIAGAVSGLMGTISAIGGPPMALLYQNAGAARLRSTLAGFFVLGTTISVVALWAVGRFGVEEVWLSILLCPAMAAGFFLAVPLRSRVSGRAIRPLVLGLSLAAAALVLWRTLPGLASGMPPS